MVNNFNLKEYSEIVRKGFYLKKKIPFVSTVQYCSNKVIQLSAYTPRFHVFFVFVKMASLFSGILSIQSKVL